MPPTNPAPEWVTLREYAKAHGVKYQHIHNWVKAGRFGAINVLHSGSSEIKELVRMDSELHYMIRSDAPYPEAKTPGAKIRTAAPRPDAARKAKKGKAVK